MTTVSITSSHKETESSRVSGIAEPLPSDRPSEKSSLALVHIRITQKLPITLVPGPVSRYSNAMCVERALTSQDAPVASGVAGQ